MTEPAIIFALVFFAAALAFAIFEADAWVRKQRRYRARYEAPAIEPIAMPTFQHFAADSADEKGAWGPTA
jgi:hypothetical protein